jgi:hypothetical protein
MDTQIQASTRAVGLAPRVAVLIPCCNEAGAIAKVVTDFRYALPEATIYVYDNNSRDRTIAVARHAGAEVRREPLQGKGNVVRRMFADIDADVYLLVDGDDTYDSSTAPGMIHLLLQNRLDMVTGVRVSDAVTAYRRGHRFGNWMLTGLVQLIFGCGVSDMLSGYRAFSRRFVKSYPGVASGFEAETEFTVHALQMRMPIAEVRTIYKDRPAGTESKLRTYSDGIRILRMIMQLVKQERPLQFFGLCSSLMLAVGIGLGTPVILTFVRTGLVPRLPTAVLATGCVLIACLSFTAGLILEAVTHGRMEIKRLGYLAIPPYEAGPAPSVLGDAPSSGMAARRFGEPGLLRMPRDAD